MQKFYEKDNITLFQGDCIEILNKATSESIDMIFADPPYMLSNGGITCKSGKVVSVNKGKWDESKGLDEDFEFHKKWINACKRVLKPDATIWISGTYHSIYACGFALQKAGFKILNDICWFKPNASPNMTCRYFTASHETLLWAIKDGNAKHTFNYEIMKNGDWSEDFKNLSEVKKASRFIYLNRTCFNGLYRVNSQGQFNVPFGNYKNPRIIDERNLRNCSELLQKTEIRCADFAEVLNHAQNGDFVYFDPPYVPLNETSSFTSYTKDGFDIDMQFKLREVCDELDSMGVMFMLSNSDTKFVNELYSNYQIKKVFASRAVNANANGRGKITEVLVRNY